MKEEDCQTCNGKGYVYVEGDCGAFGGNCECIYCNGTGKQEIDGGFINV